jgi:hypothetical protein
MPAFPGVANTWVPSWEATGQVIGFCMDPKKFKCNQYLTFRPAKKMTGLFLELDSSQFIRVPTDDEYAWPDGAERPNGNNNLMGFDFREYSCQRRDFPVTIGNLTLEQTDWPILAIHSQMVMSQAMVSLTRRSLNVLETSGNYPASNVATATALNGGLWTLANLTAANAYIRRAFNAVVTAILASTNSVVRPENVCAVLPPAIAQRISESDEIRDYLKQSPFALAQVRGDEPSANGALYNLPDQLYGVNVVVEDARVETARKGATSAAAFLKNGNTIVFTSKQEVIKGDFVGDKSTLPNFSTYQVFYYGEQGVTDAVSGQLVIETWDDVRNKRKEIHVVQNTAERMVAGGSGFLLTNVLS